MSSEPDQIKIALDEIRGSEDLDSIRDALSKIAAPIRESLAVLLVSDEADLGAIELALAVHREELIAAVKASDVNVTAPARLVDAIMPEAPTEVAGPSLHLHEFEPADEPVDGGDLLDAIRAVVRRFLVLRSSSDVNALAL